MTAASPGIQAIETRYAGCRFRSRLEARWAVFFDHLGVPWEYEPQGFVTTLGPYLPDFLIAGHTYVEVKGHEAALDQFLLRTFVDETRTRLLVLGPVPPPRTRGDYGWVLLDPAPRGDDDPGDPYLFGQRVGFSRWERHRHLWFLTYANANRQFWDYGEADQEPWGTWTVPTFDPVAPAIESAYTAARSARFEYGESGASR